MLGHIILYLCATNDNFAQKKRVCGFTWNCRLGCWDKCVSHALFYEMTKDRRFSKDFFKGQLITRWLFQDASIANLCTLVLERYIAIVMRFKYLPLMTRHRALKMIFLPWTTTIVFILLESSLWIALNSTLTIKIFTGLLIIVFLYHVVLLFFV